MRKKITVISAWVLLGAANAALARFIWKVMKISFVQLFFLISVSVVSMANDLHAQGVFDRKVSLKLDKVSLKKTLVSLETAANVRFVYSRNHLNLDEKITLDANMETLGQVLGKLLIPRKIDFKVNAQNNYIVLTPSPATGQANHDPDPLPAQREIKKRAITGKVTGDKGEVLPGVSILVKGTAEGTTSNADGNFSIEVDEAGVTLVFSYIGYVSKEVAVNGQAMLDVVLQEDLKTLNEVVVVGYGTQQKSDLTGSVASISSKKFADQRVTQVDQILQGRAAGVVVTSNSGAPGGEAKIRIRGANSALGSNDPLYVIDGFVGADYTMVNPNDIASLEVLKDASSTAIYGSRGSNGVVIITTKGGKKGKLDVQYSGALTVSNVIGRMSLLNAADFATVVNERNAALGQNPTFTADQINSYRQNGGTDWQDNIYRQATGNEHQFGISGSTDKTSFLVSANYLDQPGVIKNSGYKRYTLRSNLTTQFNDRLSFRLKINGANATNLNNLIRQGATINPSVQALTWAPTTPIYNANGDYTISDPVSSVKPNPVASIFDQENRGETFFGNVIGGLNYELLKGLSIDIQYVVDFKARTAKAFSGNYVSNFVPSAAINNDRETILQNTNALNFNRTFNEVHKINATAVFENQAFTGNYSGALSTGLKFPDLKYDNLSQAGSFAATSNFSKWTLLSWLGRINYTFKDRYLFSVSVRRDGSSKFNGGNRFSTFPAVALGWNLGQENFIKNLGFLSALKLRTSWGLTGSQAIQPYATRSAYNNVIYAFDANSLMSGIQLGNPGNQNLKWETTHQKDIGLEVGLFNDRLNIELDYYVKNTKDLLLNRPVPSYLGGGEITSNLGEIQNKGWELAIGGTILNTKNIVWQSDFNVSYVNNRVVSLGGIADRIFTGQNTTGISPLSEFVFEPGRPLGSFWGLKYLGTWKPSEAIQAAEYGNVPGDARYEDTNGDKAIGSADYQIVGSGFPKGSAGWNNSVSYKGFTLNFFFQGIFGVRKFNYSRGMTLFGERDARQITSADIKDRYIPGVNETSDFPAFSRTSKIMPQSTMFMEKGDFVRLKNLSLSYSFPKTIIPRISNIKVSVYASNLLTFTKYKGVDPETSSNGSGSDLNQGIDYGSYPNAKTVTLRLALTL